MLRKSVLSKTLYIFVSSNSNKRDIYTGLDFVLKIAWKTDVAGMSLFVSPWQPHGDILLRILRSNCRNKHHLFRPLQMVTLRNLGWCRHLPLNVAMATTPDAFFLGYFVCHHGDHMATWGRHLVFWKASLSPWRPKIKQMAKCPVSLPLCTKFFLFFTNALEA